METDTITIIVHWKMKATAEDLIVPKPIITIAMQIHGQITVATEISVMLMETDTVTIVVRGQMMATEKDLMTAPMRLAVKIVAVRLVIIIEETQSEMEILVLM
jgi:hypothetical protein